MSKPTKIFLGLPCYDGWNPKFAISLISCLSGGPPCILQTLDGDSLIPRARNNLAADFLASDASHLLFLDTDLEFGKPALHRLMSHDLDVVGGVYLQKRLDRQIPVFNKLDDRAPGNDGMVEVRHVGTGMMMIARHVFERLIEGGAKRFHTCDDEAKQEWRHEFFPIGVGPDARYESEDWAFCRMVRECGMSVWVDTHVYAKHHGSGVYPNDAVEAMRVQLAEVKDMAKEAIQEGTKPSMGDRCLKLAQRIQSVLAGEIREEGRR